MCPTPKDGLHFMAVAVGHSLLWTPVFPHGLSTSDPRPLASEGFSLFLSLSLSLTVCHSHPEAPALCLWKIYASFRDQCHLLQLLTRSPKQRYVFLPFAPSQHLAYIFVRKKQNLRKELFMIYPIQLPFKKGVSFVVMGDGHGEAGQAKLVEAGANFSA